MGYSRLTLRRASWLLCACFLLLPRFAAAAETSIAVDFDGDGQRDHVTLYHREPMLLQVWLSASDTTQVIRSLVPLIRVSATDLDGDHRPELIASDSDLQIHVWSRTHKGFHSYPPRNVHPTVPTAGKQPNRVDDNDTEPGGVIAGTGLAPFALARCSSPHSPMREVRPAHAPRSTRACESFTAVDPFAPRPPPARFPL